jgi:hypothetical protein
MKDNKHSLFIEYVKQSLMTSTYFNNKLPYHIYLGKCNISVHLNHSGERPYFGWIPDCFYSYCEDFFGLTDSDIESMWDNWYKEYIIDMYLKK